MRLAILVRRRSTARVSCGSGCDATPATSPGIPAPRTRPSRSRPAGILSYGGCIFAEDPSIAVPAARIVWRAEIDPETLLVDAPSVGADSADRVDAELLRKYLFLVQDPGGVGHGVLSDGVHRIRFDVMQGTLCSDEAVTLRCSIYGTHSAEPKLRPLARLLDLCRRGCFAPTLFPREPKSARWIALLRVHDALAAGASGRDIAAELYGAQHLAASAGAGADSLRSRVRRLVREARAMARGGYRTLLHDRYRVGRARRR